MKSGEGERGPHKGVKEERDKRIQKGISSGESVFKKDLELTKREGRSREAGESDSGEEFNSSSKSN